MEIEGKQGTTFEILHELDLQNGFPGHGTSLTWSFVAMPSEGDAFALYVWYPIVDLLAKQWSDEKRWRDAKEQVTSLLKSLSAWDIKKATATATRKPLGEWKPTDDGWEKRGLQV